MAHADRADLLAWLDRYAAGSPVEVRRVERWRRRGWSGARVARAARAAAAALAARGVGPGDRVALCLPDGPLWHAGFFGALRAGAVPVPLDVSLDPATLARLAGEIGVAAWITGSEAPEVTLHAPRVDLSWEDDPAPGALPAPPPDDPDRTAEIVLAAGAPGVPGATGLPDAVAVRHRDLTAILDALAARVGARGRFLRALPPPRLAVTLPLSHLDGQVMGVFMPAILGARVSLVEAMPAPDLARALRDEGAWVLATTAGTLDLLGRHLRRLGEDRWGKVRFGERLAGSLAGPAWRRPARFRALRRILGHRLVAVVSGEAALERETEDLWRGLGYAVVRDGGLTVPGPPGPRRADADRAPPQVAGGLAGPDVAFAAVAREVARVTGGDAGALRPDDRLGDVLGSLDRVEVVARLEEFFGVSLGDSAYAGARELGPMADDLATPTGPALLNRADRVPRARWRRSLPARVGRLAILEAAIRPFWHSLFEVDAAGAAHLDGLAPPFIVAANHASELDPGPVLFGLPYRHRSRIAPVAMWEWFEGRPAGPFLYRLAVVGLDLIPLLQQGDWRPTLEIAGRVADRGGCPLVFPEGERTLDGALLRFHPGVAVLARELHLPIVPCAISGLLAVLPKGAHWPRGCWRSRARLAVRFGAPLPAPRPTDDPGAVVAELRRRMGPLHAAARAAAGRY